MRHLYIHMRWDSMLVSAHPTTTKWDIDQGLIRKQSHYSEKVVHVCHFGSKWRRKFEEEKSNAAACDSLLGI